MLNFRFKLAITALCLLAFGMAGCGTAQSTNSQQNQGQAAPTVSQESTPTTAPTTPTQAAPTATAASSNPLDALANLVHSFGSVKSFRVQITTAGKGSNPSGAVTMEYVQPDRFHMAIPGIEEIIVIGKTEYAKTGASAQWRTLSLSKSFTPPVDPQTMVSKLATAKGVSFSGPGLLNGKPMLVYQYNPTAADDPSTQSGTMWVGATDGLPYQMQANGRDGSKVTVVFSDYNADIQINPPTS